MTNAMMLFPAMTKTDLIALCGKLARDKKAPERSPPFRIGIKLP